ncbi:hypothetical protein Dsin_021349 [Dipteronia sinensis]|uniref:Pectinesterase inhibitor domain-containing protein n=1 Tax=Dipteronia sinensis TaxID=43782 RepID=A0AAE0DZ06_9ROSI|nr:hypothetical protein Dsin_021349 [Dipteronia sinensis]
MVDLPFFVLSIAIRLLFVSQNNIVTAKDDNNGVLSLIRKTCYNGTPFPDTCVTVLEADPRSRAATDLISLSLSAMDIVYEDAKYITSCFVKA